MKKIVSLALLLSTVNLVQAESTMMDTIMQYMNPGQPAVASAPAADRPAVAAMANQSDLAKITTNIPSLIANIKLLAPKAMEIAAKTAQGGWLSGLTSVFTSMDNETRTAFVNLATQVGGVVASARNLLASADPATQSMVKSLLTQVTSVPEFKTLLDQASNIPLVGAPLKEYLTSLTQEAR